MKIRTFLASAFCLLALTGQLWAYTAYPSLSAGSGNTGLTTGSLIGYTVLGADGASVATARTTAGIVELGNGSYAVPAGITVPDGSTYYVKWDRSDTSTVLGAAPTVPTSYAYTLQTNQAAINTKLGTPAGASVSADILTANTTLAGHSAALGAISTNAATAATQATTAATGTTSNGTAIAALPNAAANASAVWGAGARTLTAQADTPGTTTLLGRLTSGRATGLDFLDAAITSRMATFTYTAPPLATDNAAATVTAIKADTLIAKLLNQRLGKFTYNPATKVLTVKGDDGATLGTVTLTVDGSGNITARQ